MQFEKISSMAHYNVTICLSGYPHAISVDRILGIWLVRLRRWVGADQHDPAKIMHDANELKRMHGLAGREDLTRFADQLIEAVTEHQAYITVIVVDEKVR